MIGRNNGIARDAIQRIEQHLGLQANKGSEKARRGALSFTPGVSIAIIHHGELVWAKGYGVLDREAQAPVDEQTLFQAASISKPLVAALTLHLVDQRTLALDEDIRAYLTSWYLPTRGVPQRITLRHLLCHGAGITPAGFPGYERDDPLPSMRQIFNGEPPAVTPAVMEDASLSRQSCYSGGGYCVLQQILVDVTGLPFPVLMQRALLEPLGMLHSTYSQPLSIEWYSSAASGHHADGTPLTDKWRVYPEQAAAGLWTTPSDLARFILTVQQAQTNHGHPFLSRRMVQQMITPPIQSPYGLGIFVVGKGPSQRFSHSGSSVGFRSYFEACVYAGSGLVVMTNGEKGAQIFSRLRTVVSSLYQWPDVVL